MQGTNMKALWCFILLLFLLQGCASLFRSDEDIRKEQEAQFEPYRQKNSIEAYRTFIQKYPDNIFIPLAKGTIEDLEFAPYEQQNSIAGYREFIKAFPANRNSVRAVEKIDQLEFSRIEDMDTAAAYREFIRKNPHSNYTMLAQQRLQELEFRELDKTCREQYRFDLMLYRLTVSRLQKELKPAGAVDLADFTLFASIDTYKGQRCFHTLLIYGDTIARLDTKSKESTELFFEPVIAKLLVYLDNKFARNKEISGFSFTIASSPNRFYGDAAVLFKYYFPSVSVHQFAQRQLGHKELLAGAIVSQTVFPH